MTDAGHTWTTTAAVGNTEVIADLVTSSDPFKQLLGRALASPIAEDFQIFVNSEIERGSDPADIVTVLINLHVQFMASITGSMFEPQSYDAIRDFVIDRVNQIFITHATSTGESKRQMLAGADG